MKKNPLIPVVVIGCIVLLLVPAGSSIHVDSESRDIDSLRLSFSEQFSELRSTIETDMVRFDFAEANAWSVSVDEPQLPYVSRVLEFPVGTSIRKVEVTPTKVEMIAVNAPVQSAPAIQKMNGDIDTVNMQSLVSGENRHGGEWFSYSTGMGINRENNNVLFLSLHLMPCQLDESGDLMQYAQCFDVSISYTYAPQKQKEAEGYDLLIIAPDQFSASITPLISHKESYDLTTLFTSVEEIYNHSTGRDQAEKIKYYIKDMFDDHSIQYVLLVGDVKRVPIRKTYASRWEADLLSDLYYADLYDSNYSFCSWDENNNDKFGETRDGKDLDGVDLYADLHIGRLPCSSQDEVELLVDKIINYEQQTYNQLWFQKIVLAGGDTFPILRGSPPFMFEGEITNRKVAQQLPEFKKVRLWASLRTLNAFTFNRAINKGAGFVSYAGHGFEHGWGTYRPNALAFKMGIRQHMYFTPYIRGLRNQNRLPIIFFDACLTAKLDFNVTDLQQYFPLSVRLLTRLGRMNEDPNVFFPCFAWAFLRHEGGGAIATIGATRTAYTMVGPRGVYGGAGYLDVHFFKAYEEGVTVGEMLTASQNDYINNVGPDYFTIEEFMLVGDPSLRVGGYP